LDNKVSRATTKVVPFCRSLEHEVSTVDLAEEMVWLEHGAEVQIELRYPSIEEARDPEPWSFVVGR
jgi:hypothetical protein